MRKAKAALGTFVFLLVVPRIVAGLVPWLITDWRIQDDYLLPLRAVGTLLVAGGLAALLHAFTRFVVDGLGTPAPVAPTKSLVVGGLYRFVRNPMYLAVAAIIVGQALLLGRPILFLYCACFGLAVASFVRWYEEPALARRFGTEYETYRQAVPAWWPRRTTWNGGHSGRPFARGEGGRQSSGWASDGRTTHHEEPRER